MDYVSDRQKPTRVLGFEADFLISGRDDFNREYSYNGNSFTMNDKRDAHLNQDVPDNGEEDDEYNSGEEVCSFIGHIHKRKYVLKMYSIIGK